MGKGIPNGFVPLSRSSTGQTLPEASYPVKLQFCLRLAGHGHLCCCWACEAELLSSELNKRPVAVSGFSHNKLAQTFEHQPFEEVTLPLRLEMKLAMCHLSLLWPTATLQWDLGPTMYPRLQLAKQLFPVSMEIQVVWIYFQ